MKNKNIFHDISDMFGDSPVHGSFKKKAKCSYKVRLVLVTVYWVSKHSSHRKLPKVNIFRQMIHSYDQPPHRASRLWESLLSARGRFKQQMKLETKFSFDLIQTERHFLNQTVRELSVYIFSSGMRFSLGPLEGKLPSVWAAEDLSGTTTSCLQRCQHGVAEAHPAGRWVLWPVHLTHL